MKVTKSDEKGNLECRVLWDEAGKIVCVAEHKNVEGLTPDDYNYFFENWSECILSVNLLLKSAVVVDESEGFQII